eukprot:26612_1
MGKSTGYASLSGVLVAVGVALLLGFLWPEGAKVVDKATASCTGGGGEKTIAEFLASPDKSLEARRCVQTGTVIKCYVVCVRGANKDRIKQLYLNAGTTPKTMARTQSAYTCDTTGTAGWVVEVSAEVPECHAPLCATKPITDFTSSLTDVEVWKVVAQAEDGANPVAYLRCSDAGKMYAGDKKILCDGTNWKPEVGKKADISCTAFGSVKCGGDTGKTLSTFLTEGATAKSQTLALEPHRCQHDVSTG